MKNVLAILVFVGVVGWLFYNEYQTQTAKAAAIKHEQKIRSEKQQKELERDLSSIKLED